MLVFAATALCTFLLSQRCAYQCLTASGFLLYTNTIVNQCGSKTNIQVEVCGGGVVVVKLFSLEELCD